MCNILFAFHSYFINYLIYQNQYLLFQDKNNFQLIQLVQRKKLNDVVMKRIGRSAIVSGR